ncbi:acyl-CoA synthetase [Halosimplex amylolyticum]|uniref:acyl-CoA synthetase n=1 Tax=Halosimplex amylolyticum TaxID=3396616 RepID=UPI003F56624E
MTSGYDLPGPSDEADPDAWDGFEWRIPETYNIASVALDHDPDRTAIRHVEEDGDRHEFTYGELERAASALAVDLKRNGVESGDRVAVCLPQCPEHAVVHLAAYRCGAVTVPLSMLLGQDTVRYQLTDCNVQTLFLDSQRAAALPDDATAVTERVVTVTPGSGDYTGPLRALGGLEAVVGGDGSTPAARTSVDDPAVILYTSGTSGHPKGVLQSHGYLLGSLPGYHYCFHLFDDADYRDALLWTPSEWAWAGALFDVVLPTLATGGTVLSTERRTGFDPSSALDRIEDESVTHAFFPPTALSRMRSETDPAGRDLGSLDVVMCGGEKLLPAVFEWSESELGVTVNETYGQTEANMLVGNSQTTFPARAGSMGKPYPGHDVAVVDEDGDPLPPGELGEIVVEPPDPVTLIEYWDDPAATDAKFFDDGRMRTGDLARRDEDGYLWHAGRKDHLIITSGYRVSPLEVESALTEEPRVAAAVVGGVPDPERGQRVKAYLRLTNGHDPSETLAAELREHVRERLGAHKVPRDIEFIESIPETHSGKADRTTLFSE